MTDITFTLTRAHLTLLRALRWERGHCETGGPAVNPKRPFGNSYVEPDIAKALGWEWPDEDKMSVEDFDAAIEVMEERCMKIYRETETALEIVAGRAGLASPPGFYLNTALPYHAPKWVPADNIIDAMAGRE